MNRTPHAQRSPSLIDPGWLFLLSGMGILAATVLVPAAADLQTARFQRDRALAIEAHRVERLNRYEEYLSALDSHEPSLILSLAASQLNEIPEGRSAISGAQGALGADSDVSVFPSLEPPPLVLPTRQTNESTLERLTTNDHTRLWLIAGGAASVLIGLFPASSGWGHPGRRHPYLE